MASGAHVRGVSSSRAGLTDTAVRQDDLWSDGTLRDVVRPSDGVLVLGFEPRYALGRLAVLAGWVTLVPADATALADVHARVQACGWLNLTLVPSRAEAELFGPFDVVIAPGGLTRPMG